MGWFQTVLRYGFAIVPGMVMEYILLTTYSGLIETYNIPGVIIFFLAVSIPLVLILLFYLMVRDIQSEPPYRGSYIDY